MAIEQTQAKNPDLIATPNRVLEALAEFSVYQLRIYATIIELLQESLKRSFEEGSAAVNEIVNQDVILLSIPLKKISKPSEYRDVKQSLLKMSKINCEITYSKNGKKQIMSGSLFTADMPIEPNRRSNITIRLHPQVARLMLTFQRNDQGQPTYYSKFDPEIVRKLRNKHTIRLYFFLCLWRNKRRLNIKVDKLYQILGLGSTYPLFSNFKKHILLPASNDLAGFRDVWFEIDNPNMFVKQGNKVVELNLGIMTQEVIKDQELKKEKVVEMLKTHFKCTKSDLDEIKDILDEVPYFDIMSKINSVHNQITPKVKHRNGYVIKALKEEFLSFNK